jgi:hypothetical protein
VVHVVEIETFWEVREYRTGEDGRCQVRVNSRSHQTELHAQKDDRALGWASINLAARSPLGTEKDLLKIVLLPRNRQVEGSIRDTAGKPIRGAQVRVFQLHHEANGFATDHRGDQEEPLLGSAVTDETGRYTVWLPENSRATLRTSDPRYFGPLFQCVAGDRSIAPVTLQDAGGIAGTVIDSITGKAVERASVGSQLIELSALRLRHGGIGAKRLRTLTADM